MCISTAVIGNDKQITHLWGEKVILYGVMVLLSTQVCKYLYSTNSVKKKVASFHLKIILNPQVSIVS